MITNGIPNNANITLPCDAMTTQKIANPHQSMLKGIKNISANLKTIPCLGRPVHSRLSSLSRCSLNTD